MSVFLSACARARALSLSPLPLHSVSLSLSLFPQYTLSLPYSNTPPPTHGLLSLSLTPVSSRLRRFSSSSSPRSVGRSFVRFVAGLDNRPTLWSNDGANQEQKNYRGISDLVGTVDEALAYRALSAKFRAAAAERSRRQSASVQMASWEACAATAALRNSKRESFYKLLKLLADTATYFPQCNWVIWTRWTTHAPYSTWHDGLIGVAGVVAAVCSCRAEWIKMGSKSKLKRPAEKTAEEAPAAANDPAQQQEQLKLDNERLKAENERLFGRLMLEGGGAEPAAAAAADDDSGEAVVAG
eukprot:SAG22_NODE_1613_length_3995_cov_4.374230_2_plen_298_part_00